MFKQIEYHSRKYAVSLSITQVTSKYNRCLPEKNELTSELTLTAHPCGLENSKVAM